MERITLHDKTFRIIIPHDDIQKSIEKLAAKMNREFNGNEVPLFLSVLNGSFMFTSDLLKKLTFQCELSFIKVSSYSGVESTGEMKHLLGLNTDIKGRTVVLVEDIVDTGATIVELHSMLTKAGAARVIVCTLLLKPDAYKKDIPVDYVAIEIPNDFIVGYGLDYDELGRQYKDIYVLDTSSN